MAREESRDGVSEYVVFTHYTADDMRGTDKRLKGRTAGMKFISMKMARKRIDT